MTAKEVMDKYYAAYNTGGYDNVPFSEDIVFESLFGVVTGRENVVNHLIEAHGGDIVGEKLLPFNIVYDENKVAVELNGELSFKEDVPNFPFGEAKKGETIVVRFAAFYEIKNDEIARATIYKLL